MTNECLTAKNIVKNYKEKKVLKNINLTLEPNKIYGLIGRNGTGKTTLLSVLSAQAKATDGEVKLGNAAVWENQEVLNQICFSREITTAGIVGGLKVKEYLFTAEQYMPNWDKDYANRLLKTFGLEKTKKERINKLSKGMMSMLTIVVALASKAPYTFLDEPVAGLDIVAREQFYKLLLEEYTETGRTFVISTHIIEEAADLFEETIFLKDGEILLQENTHSLIERSVQITGREDEVEKCLNGVRAYHKETFGRSLNLIAISEPGQSLNRLADVDITPVNLEKVFLALCGEEEKE